MGPRMIIQSMRVWNGWSRRSVMAITFLFLAVLRAADTMQPKTGGGVVIGTLPEWSDP
jgi:hypothetical protein